MSEHARPHSARFSEAGDYRYRFCPYDGTKLILRDVATARALPSCATCDFVDYGSPKPCVAVLVEHAGQLLLGRRAVEPARGAWDIPGGFVEPGESAEQAVARELLEESGLHVVDIRYFTSRSDVYGPRGVPTLNLCFTARATARETWPGSDVAELAWFPPAGLPRQLAFPHQRELLHAWVQYTEHQSTETMR